MVARPESYGTCDMNRSSFRFASCAASVLLAAGIASAAADTPPTHDTYSDDEIAKAASEFFSTGARELSDVLAKVLKDKGPTDRLDPWRGVRRGPRFAVRLG